MSMKITGIDQLQRKLSRLQTNAQALDGKHEVPLSDLMPDSFIARHTQFSSLQEMIDASAIEDPEDLSGEQWNSYVAANSQFSSWEEMQREAAGEWAKRKLFSGF
jgi:hypothetical protein